MTIVYPSTGHLKELIGTLYLVNREESVRILQRGAIYV